MCHHYIANKALAQYAREFQVRHFDPAIAVEKDLWPLKQGPIIRLDDNGERELVAAEWGLLPRWWKPSDKKPKRASSQRQCVNARCETIHEKPSYRSAFKDRRCLIPANEFFEYGHYFHLPNKESFALAGLWEQWGSGEDAVTSYVMVTTTSNEAVMDVGNDRMAVMLTTEDECAQWLNPEVKEWQRLEHLFRPFPASEMEYYAKPEKSD